MNDTMVVDFSPLNPVSIAYAGSTTINLDNYVTDPRQDPIEEWLYDPAFSTCFDITKTNNQVTLTHISNSRCQETFSFEAVGSNNRRASDTITINAG